MLKTPSIHASDIWNGWVGKKTAEKIVEKIVENLFIVLLRKNEVHALPGEMLSYVYTSSPFDPATPIRMNPASIYSDSEGMRMLISNTHLQKQFSASFYSYLIATGLNDLQYKFLALTSLHSIAILKPLHQCP